MPGKVAEQNLPRCLAIASDEAQPQEEAPECVLLAFHLGLFGENPLDFLRHRAKGGEETHVSLRLFRLRHPIPPREGNLVARHLDVEPICS